MAGSIILEVTRGPMKGLKFQFKEPDKFWFGRSKNCNLCIRDDPEISRYHFFMEITPPEVFIRDLGSLNGTYVNGEKCGGRSLSESPKEGSSKQFPEVYLKNGDRIEAGQTAFAIKFKEETFVQPPEELEPLQEIAPETNTRSELPEEAAPEQKATPPMELEVQKPAQRAMDEIEYDEIDAATLSVPVNQLDQAIKQATDGTMAETAAKSPEHPVNCVICKSEVSEELYEPRDGSYICSQCRKDLMRANNLDNLSQVLRINEQVDRLLNLPKLCHYVLEKKIGEGDLGAVYLALRKKDQKWVTLKTIFSQIPTDEQSRKRFLRQVVMTAIFMHPNIVTLYDYGYEGGVFYILMEYCELGCLRKLMERKGGKIDCQRALPIMLQTLMGLEYVHSKNIVHGSIKPENILLVKDRQGKITAKVSDVGLAAFFATLGFWGTANGAPPFANPYVLAPEYLENLQNACMESDIWSMGATFYYMLTGHYPRDIDRYHLPSRKQLLKAEIVPVREWEENIPQPLAEVIDKALALRINERYTQAGQMREAIEALL